MIKLAMKAKLKALDWMIIDCTPIYIEWVIGRYASLIHQVLPVIMNKLGISDFELDTDDLNC